MRKIQSVADLSNNNVLATSRPSRREVLAMLASGLVLAASGGSEGTGAMAAEHMYTVDDLLASESFRIAHRGSGDNWPEHSAQAYRQAVACGARAIEISVQATVDGVLVCHHDLNTQRMTGVDLDIAATTFEQLAGLRNDARAWLGPRSGLVPIPQLKDVLDEHATRRVIFIEDKQGTNTEALLEMMDSYPDATEHFVWKQPADSNRYRVAQQHGYRTWGYFTEDYLDRLDEFADRYDMLGMHHNARDEVIARFVLTGKPVICWEVHTRHLRDRLLSSGVRGLMTSNYPYVSTHGPIATTDGFATGLRAAGDLPWALAWSQQPTIDPEATSIRLDSPEKSSYCMGSMCPISAGEYTLAFEMRWADAVPRNGEHAGIAFGQKTDLPYRVREPGAGSGYHLVVHADGVLELFGRVADTISGYSLARIATKAPLPGAWLRLTVKVTPEQIIVARWPMPGEEFEVRVFDLMVVNNQDFRGGYFSLCKNYSDGPAVEFRSISAAEGSGSRHVENLGQAQV